MKGERKHMKINSANYLREHADGTDAHMADALVRGCKAVLREHGGFRGGLGDLGAAIGKHVSIPGLLVVSVLRKQAESLRAEGLEITLHDADGYDVEIKPIAAPVTET
jgi:hypothetical protein